MSDRLITVAVGTWHQQFNRLVAWADLRERMHSEDHVTIQYGSSRPPAVATGVEFLAPTEVRALMAGSDVVITHGGPGTIMDARNCGHRPLVLARDPAHGEHVDEHQLLFTRWAADKGLVDLVNSVDELDDRVSRLGGSGTRVSPAAGLGAESSVRRVRQLLDADDGRRLPVAPDATTVLFVANPEEVSSTRLDDALRQLPRVTALGDVTQLWDRRVREQAQCVCGEPFSMCAFWTSVGDHAFGGWSRLDSERLLILRGSVDGQRRILRIARRHPGARSRRLLVEYTSYYRRIYDAARQVSGAAVVVHSASQASAAVALSHNRHIDLRVTDVRSDAERCLDLSIRALSYRGVPTAHVRRGDLLADTRTAVCRVWESLSLPGSMDRLEDATSSPGCRHGLSGGQR